MRLLEPYPPEDPEARYRHDYTLLHNRVHALHAFRHGIHAQHSFTFFSLNTSTAAPQYHRYEPLFRWKILSEEERRTWEAALSNKKERLFLLKKFPYYPLCTYAAGGEPVREDFFFSQADIDDLADGLVAEEHRIPPLHTSKEELPLLIFPIPVIAFTFQKAKTAFLPSSTLLLRQKKFAKKKNGTV